MADIIRTIFKNKKVNLSKLPLFGFEKSGSDFVYEKTLPGSGFKLNVTITAEGEIGTEVFDPSFEEPYVLHLVDGAAGSFVGGIRLQYEETLTDIANQCFEPDVFKSAQAKALIEYVRDSYKDELEFLWKKSDNAIWRRKDTGKWYAALLTVSKQKLGIESNDPTEILNLRILPDELESLIDNTKYFPGYHMNKKHWYTVILDGSVPLEEIFERIHQSYLLAR